MILLHNLTGVYEGQDFYLPYEHFILQEKELSGIRGYMEEEVKEKLKILVEKHLPSSKLHFLDSGNFHHISFLYVRAVREDFILVVFDHHTDMQDSAFGSILSCGSWILEALRECPHLKKVVMVGVKKEYREAVSALDLDRVIFVEDVEEFANTEGLPLYLSVDKDVLAEEEFSCDWDQGEMRLSSLLRQILTLQQREKILGVDVCGEPPSYDTASIQKSNLINQSILNVFSDFFHL